jgi:hypothetical protein
MEGSDNPKLVLVLGGSIPETLLASRTEKHRAQRAEPADKARSLFTCLSCEADGEAAWTCCPCQATR